MGWSEKWNIEVDKNDNRIAPRNSIVPNWRKLIKIGYILEYKSHLNNTWSSGVCTSLNEENIIKILSCDNISFEFNINSPDIAEPYTHCGYNKKVTSDLRLKFLLKQREIYKLQLNNLNKEKKNNITSLAIKNFNFIFNNPIESNIKFIIDNKIIYAHRIILIAHSKYFKCLFSNKYNDYKNTDIIINNYKYDIF